ncbi:integrase [Paenibacillus sp. FSL R7-269]|uniref:site-specific integrase n=1 Tax=Paenibacillus sp. FSL R7-269 TaxID=1226755 RepID=UPI0003E28E14|nr:site-specific integrase [Paenibacillus sp. FSL R7-269]ETT53153.1 integrase [Paenibacillus sp. FSL R7-269]
MASIEKRGDNSWRLIVELGTDAQGRRLKKTKTVKVEDATLLRAKKRLNNFLNEELMKFRIEVEAGEYIAPEKMLFSAFVEEWEKKYAVKHLEVTTLNTYKRCLKKRILPTFGDYRLDQVKPIHILNYLDSLEQDGSRLDGKQGKLSSGSVFMMYRILKNIFSRAVEWRIIKNNPVADVTRPRVKHKETKVYTKEEIHQLFEVLQNEPFHWRMMITLALTTGMRRGELLGLEWRHIDLKNGVIDIRQSITAYKDGEPLIKEPKTKNSLRKVALPSSITAELNEYYLHCRKERMKLKNIWKRDEHFFLFFNEEGKPFYPETPYLHFRNLLLKHKLPYITFHSLRHTSATLLLNQGVHAKIISERLGHANISTTMNIYGHVLRSADHEAANKFDSILPNIKAK